MARLPNNNIYNCLIIFVFYNTIEYKLLTIFVEVIDRLLAAMP